MSTFVIVVILSAFVLVVPRCAPDLLRVVAEAGGVAVGLPGGERPAEVGGVEAEHACGLSEGAAGGHDQG